MINVLAASANTGVDRVLIKTWRISLKQGVVFVEFEDGAVTGAGTFMEISRELHSNPEKYRSSNLVLDLRNIVPGPDTGFESLQNMVQQFKATRQAGLAHKKTALVVAGKLAFGLSRIYASLVEDSLDYQVNVFEDDLQAAIAWAAYPD
jgi:hypothetical protein